MTTHQADDAPESAWLSIASPDGGGTHLRITRQGARWIVDAVFVHAAEVTMSAVQRVPISQVDLAMNLAPVHDMEQFRTLSRLGSFASGEVPVIADSDDLTLAELAERAASAPADFRVQMPAADRPALTRPDGTDPDGFYASVARAYAEYAPKSRGPAVEIAREAGVPVATARSWVREARRRGKLPAGRPGKAG